VSYVAFVGVSARAIRYFGLAEFGLRFGADTGSFLLKHGLLIGLIALAAAIVVTLVLRIYQRRRTAMGAPE
jgi:hypothetical protein